MYDPYCCVSIDFLLAKKINNKRIYLTVLIVISELCSFLVYASNLSSPTIGIKLLKIKSKIPEKDARSIVPIKANNMNTGLTLENIGAKKANKTNPIIITIDV